MRGEEPVFVVTGRKEGVAQAKEYILASAQHFTQIRANRGGCIANSSGTDGNANISSSLKPLPLPVPVRSLAASPTTTLSSSTPAGHVTIDVRVPPALVGLVIGPKGSTVKRIQKQTHTFITTPNRQMEPVFQVSGLPGNVEAARLEIHSHIVNRTFTGGVGRTSVSPLEPQALVTRAGVPTEWWKTSPLEPVDWANDNSSSTSSVSMATVSQPNWQRTHKQQHHYQQYTPYTSQNQLSQFPLTSANNPHNIPEFEFGNKSTTKEINSWYNGTLWHTGSSDICNTGLHQPSSSLLSSSSSYWCQSSVDSASCHDDTTSWQWSECDTASSSPDCSVSL